MLRIGKKTILVLSALTMILALSLSGCSSKNKSAVSEQAGTKPEPQKVELVMGHPFSAQHPISQNILIPLANELAEKSDGRITLTIHAGGAVTSAATIFEDVASGSIDMGWTLQGYTPGKYPLSEAVELPFMFDSTLQASHVFWEMFKQSEALQKEYGGVKVLGLWMVDPGEFLSVKPIKKPGDLVGMRIRFSGSAQEAMIKKFGGTPVGLPMPDVYDALERGIIDGVAVGPSVIASYKLNEVIKYATRGLHSFFSTQVIFMNKAKWDSLSPEDQALLDSLTGEVIYRKGTEIYNAAYEKGYSLGRESNVVINEITPAERKVWIDQTSSVVDEWLKKVNALGLPGQATLDLLHKLAAEFKE